jgi:hypothetical protein
MNRTSATRQTAKKASREGVPVSRLAALHANEVQITWFDAVAVRRVLAGAGASVCAERRFV